MDIELIERLIGLVERSRVTELDYVEGGNRLRIVRGIPVAPVVGPPVGGSSAAGPALAPSRAAPVTASASSDHIVAAGMFGTFFRSPAPGQPPFVAEGDLVQEGQTLGILEAMKMLNPVEADRAGRVTRVLAEDGAAVEAGAPLVAIAPTA